MFFDSVTMMLLWDSNHDNRIVAMIGAEGGARVHLARNDIVRRFLDMPPEVRYLAFIDADMVVPADFIDQLTKAAVEHDLDIVGGLCFSGGRKTIKPTIYKIFRNEQGELRSECKIGYPAPALMEVDATGAACILIDRAVLEAIAAEPKFGSTPHPWFQDQVIDGADFSEDIVFCLRAKTCGKKVWVHTGVKVGHRKKRELDEDVFKSWYKRCVEERPDLMLADEDTPLMPEQFENTGVKV